MVRAKGASFFFIGPEKHTVSDKLFFTSNFLVQKKTIINENQSGPAPAYCRTTKI